MTASFTAANGGGKTLSPSITIRNHRERRASTESQCGRAGGGPPLGLDQSEEDDYFRRLGDRIRVLTSFKLKFRLGTLLFIVACLGVLFTPLQFLELQDLPIVFGIGVAFMTLIIVLAIVIMPHSNEK